MILHVAWSGRIGGIERLVEGILRSPKGSRGYVHQACLLDGSGPIGDRLVEEGLALRLGFRRGYDVRGLWRLARALRRLRPRVIHFHTHAIGSHAVALVACPGALRVYTEHSPRSLRRDRKFQLLYGVLRRTMAAFIASSPRMAEVIARRGVEPARIVVIPNGVAMPHRAGPQIARSPATLGVVARLEPQKRLDLFLAVLAALRRSGADCVGLMVGDGSLRDDLTRHGEALGLGGVVEFAGEQENTVPWLDRMDVFLMTSEFEPFGIAALEAMARGVSVVAMPCPGGLADIVRSGGLLLLDRDVETAAASVGRLLDSEHERARLRARGTALASEHSFDRVVAELDELYRHLCRAA